MKYKKKINKQKLKVKNDMSFLNFMICFKKIKKIKHPKQNNNSIKFFFSFFLNPNKYFYNFRFLLFI